ncbi:nodulation factor ABC transporter ATP-binding protein NodI, partial [Rhizobium ruizarguesonis]
MNGQSDLQAAVAETLRRGSDLPCISISEAIAPQVGAISS